MFDFAGWLQVVLPVGALLSGLNLATVQGLGKMGVSGTTQLIGAGVTGLILGFASSIAFFGMPASFLEWFLAVVFGLIVYGGSVGTYEAVKHAASKA
jgi:drug/metabolite transporter (DMT)-like permease